MCVKDILELCFALFTIVLGGIFAIVVGIFALIWIAVSWIFNTLLHYFRTIRGGQPTKPHDLEDGYPSWDISPTRNTSDLAAAAAASASLLVTIDEIVARGTVSRDPTGQISCPPPYYQVPSSPPEYQSFNSASLTDLTNPVHVAMTVPQPCARMDGRLRESRVRSPHLPPPYGHV